MVDTINHKYFRINIKLNLEISIKINKFYKQILKVYRQWIDFDRMTDEKLQSWLWPNIEGLQYITNNAIIKNSENKNYRVNSAEQKLQ